MIELDYCNNKQKGIIKGDLLTEIREFFSIKNEAAKFLKNRYRFIPNRIYCITPTGRFNVGLTTEIMKYISDYHPLKKIIVQESLIKVLFPSKIWKQNNNFSKVILKLNLELYDYQQEVVEKCLESGRGNVVLATAGGKTLITSSIINQLKNTVYKDALNFKCLIVVPSLSLVEQTVDKFREYGVRFSYSKWTGNNDLNLSSDVIVCNTGILQSKNTDISFLETIDLLIIDEVHILRKGNVINDIVDKIKTPFKFGFTGTLPENNIDKWNIIGKIGPILYEKKSYELRKNNFITNALISILEINYNQTPNYTDSIIGKYKSEIQFLIESDYRNKIIKKIAENANKNILIMVDYIRHGEILYNILKDNISEREVFFIQGSVEADIREDVRKQMEQKDNLICVAISKIFSTGIDIKNLHHIIFAGGGKAKIKIIQSIGRGLRLHKDKKILNIIDLQDQLKYSKEHGDKRIEFYEQEKIQYRKTTLREPGFRKNSL